MMLTELLDDLRKAEVTLTVEEDGVRLSGRDAVPKNIQEQVRQALSELKDYPKCKACNRVDADYAYDENGYPYCSTHYFVIGLVTCIECGKCEALTSMTPCLECQVRRLVQ